MILRSYHIQIFWPHNGFLSPCEAYVCLDAYQISSAYLNMWVSASVKVRTLYEREVSEIHILGKTETRIHGEEE